VTNWTKEQMPAEELLPHYRERGTAEGHFGELMDVLAPALSSAKRPKSQYRGHEPEQRCEPMDAFANNEVRLPLSALAYNLVHAPQGLARGGMPRRPRAPLEVLGPGMWVLCPHGPRSQNRRTPCSGLGFHFLQQAPHRPLPLLLSLSPSQHGRGRYLQLHRLGPLLRQAPLPRRHVLASRLLQRFVRLNHWNSRRAGPCNRGKHVRPGHSEHLSTRPSFTPWAST
ncbi:MAG TPA: hypothetical protein VEU50_04670, partial [Archangium sp.]|nr:hypothetical protein [Archangium sp.]